MTKIYLSLVFLLICTSSCNHENCIKYENHYMCSIEGDISEDFITLERTSVLPNKNYVNIKERGINGAYDIVVDVCSNMPIIYVLQGVVLVDTTDNLFKLVDLKYGALKNSDSLKIMRDSIMSLSSSNCFVIHEY